jgi:hypothetical protein
MNNSSWFNTLLPYKPAVHKKVLLALAGIMWIGVGILLLSYAYQWLSASETINAIIFAAAGLTLGIVIRLYGFIKLVEKNILRINALEGKPCLFAFMSWKSYLNVFLMVGLGITLRHSSLPKLYLSPVYLGIGVGLFLSSFRYFRAFASILE